MYWSFVTLVLCSSSLWAAFGHDESRRHLDVTILFPVQASKERKCGILTPTFRRTVYTSTSGLRSPSSGAIHAWICGCSKIHQEFYQQALTTSNTPSKAAVLVWIYGGGFMAGSSALDVYDGKILAAKENVIVVSINYRLGAFGFLCLGISKILFPDFFQIEDAPCNQGLWDITLGMEWLRDNVQYFGGDPELITVFGESAGGSCVSALFMSPNTEHLAKRGILQSGTLNAPWSYLKYEDEVAISAAVGREVGCNQTLQATVPDNPNAPVSSMTPPTPNKVVLSEPQRDSLFQDPKELVACMRGIPAANISVLQWSMYNVMKFPFAPTIEGDFLKASPIEALNDGRFKKNEIMIGSNRDEGTYFLLYDFISIFNKDNATVVPKDQYLKIMGDLFPGLNEIEFQAVAFQKGRSLLRRRMSYLAPPRDVDDGEKWSVEGEGRRKGEISVKEGGKEMIVDHLAGGEVPIWQKKRR
ncbi:unnamed protein product, partial [Cyprideis torosa]